MFEIIGKKIDKAMYYRVEGKFKCNNCGREIEGFKVPKGISIKQFLRENPCKKCGAATMSKVKK